MGRGVVGHAGDIAHALGNGVDVNAGLGEFDRAEYRNGSALRGNSRGLGGHGCALGNGGDIKYELVVVVPLAALERLCHLGVGGAGGGGVGVGDYELAFAVIGYLGGKLVRIGIRGNVDRHAMGGRVVGHAGNAVVDLGYRVLVNADGAEFKLPEHGGGIALGNGELGLGGHGSALGNGFEHEGEGIGLAPIVELLGGLEMSGDRGERVGYNKAVLAVIADLGGVFGNNDLVAVLVYHLDMSRPGYGDRDGMGSRVISDAGNVIVDLRNGVFEYPYVGGGIAVLKAERIVSDAGKRCNGIVHGCDCDIARGHGSAGGDRA